MQEKREIKEMLKKLKIFIYSSKIGSLKEDLVEMLNSVIDRGGRSGAREGGQRRYHVQQMKEEEEQAKRADTKKD